MRPVVYPPYPPISGLLTLETPHQKLLESSGHVVAPFSPDVNGQV